MAERYVTLAEVKDLLETAEQGRGELSYEQKLALEHARRFAKMPGAKAKKLVSDLVELNPTKIDEPLAVRLADFAPEHADDVRAIVAKARVNFDDAEVQKILDTVVKYLGA